MHYNGNNYIIMQQPAKQEVARPLYRPRAVYPTGLKYVPDWTRYAINYFDFHLPNSHVSVNAQENKSDNGSDGSALFSLHVLISILVNTTKELYTTIISYRIPIVEPNQIRWKILHLKSDVGSLPGFLQEFIGLTEISIKSDRIRVGPVVGLNLLGGYLLSLIENVVHHHIVPIMY